MKAMYIPLVRGQETNERMALLLSLARFGENTNNALTDMFCLGYDTKTAAWKHDLIENNLVRSLKKLEAIDRIVHQLSQIN